uniref:HNF1 homeobox a n=1 Tax=Salmo trutta TaxID=8032 RepID=A0A674D6V0_SALTR
MNVHVTESLFSFRVFDCTLLTFRDGQSSKRAHGEKWGSGRLTNLQNELIWALLGSGLSREVLVQALEELEQERVTPGAEKGDRGDGESSEEGEMDFPPPIFQELEALPPEEAARERALVDQLLQEDPWHVAKLVKSYMQQHNLPQRELVESTGLNQSHLSQHLNKGTPMKNQKRAALYSWYVRKQGKISQPATSVDSSSCNAQNSLACMQRSNCFKTSPAMSLMRPETVLAECLQRGVSSSQLAGLGSNLVTDVRVYNWFANRRKEEAFRHKLALDTPYTSQSASTTNRTLAHSPVQVMKYSQQIPCDSLGSARGAHPIQLEPSHTLLETHYLVSGGGSLPPVSTLTSLHSLSASPSPPQGLNMASLPSAMSLGEFSLLIGQTEPVINNVVGGFTTLQPISFQQQLTQQFQNHMGHSPFMATMTGLPCHMYSKSNMSPYPPSSLLSQAMVVTDSSSLGTLISLSAVGEILTTDPEEETEQPIQDDSLHLQSASPVPGKKHITHFREDAV